MWEWGLLETSEEAISRSQRNGSCSLLRASYCFLRHTCRAFHFCGSQNTSFKYSLHCWKGQHIGCSTSKVLCECSQLGIGPLRPGDCWNSWLQSSLPVGLGCGSVGGEPIISKLKSFSAPIWSCLRHAGVSLQSRKQTLQSLWNLSGTIIV